MFLPRIRLILIIAWFKPDGFKGRFKLVLKAQLITNGHIVRLCDDSVMVI